VKVKTTTTSATIVAHLTQVIKVTALRLATITIYINQLNKLL